MRRIGFGLLCLLAVWGGVALAAEMGVVVTSITYVAGESRPWTLNTDGELRVECN